MASTAQRYGVGIGTGAATGAATGSAFGPWGAIVGGAVGAGAGAIGAAVQGSDEAKQHELTEEERKRRRKLLLVQYLRNEAAKYGAPTDELDARMAMEGIGHEEMLQDRALAQQNRLSPNSFVPMAQGLAQAAGGLYKYGQQNAAPTLQLGPMATTEAAAPEGATIGGVAGGPIFAGPGAAGEAGVNTMFDELNRRKYGGGYY